jgi:hypothetical protein
VRHPALVVSFLLLAAGASTAEARARAHRFPTAHTRIAVQPCDGPNGTALRAGIARVLRSRGFHVVTSLPAVSGTSQYPGLARDRGIAAFVVADVEQHPRTHIATLLVWHGDTGSVADRWSVRAPPQHLAQAVSRGLWPHLKRALTHARMPPSDILPEAPPMRIDAGDTRDEPIVSDGDPIRHRR